jgi:hypothetical protein
MGCNCKRGKKETNRLDNPDYIAQAKMVYNQVILNGNTSTYTDLDKIEIMGAYSSLYPQSSAVPSLEDAISAIKTAIEVFDVKYKR